LLTVAETAKLRGVADLDHNVFYDFAPDLANEHA